MNLFRPTSGRLAVQSLGALSMAVSVGCQSSIGGQTLPSAYYLRDDVQYYPAGPEDLLINQKRALEEYRIEQEALRQGLQPPLP